MLTAIVAIANGSGAIGKDNQLLFSIKEDLARFKKLTMGKTIIMGRKTFESLPKELKGRKCLVLSRYKEKIPNNKGGIFVNLKTLKGYIKDNKEEEIFVIGGQQVFDLLFPKIDKIHLTVVFSEKEYDTVFNLSQHSDKFEAYNFSNTLIDENTSIKFRFIDLKRIKN